MAQRAPKALKRPLTIQTKNPTINQRGISKQMADFTAKDVRLRQLTGAGMMDAKKALVENDGDAEAAAQWLREKGYS